MKKILIAIVILLSCILLTLTVCDNLKYETSKDKVIQSPNNKYSITIRQDYVSRPYIFKNNKMIFKYDGAGFNETVYWDVEWISEDEILLYINSLKEKYSKEKYYISMN